MSGNTVKVTGWQPQQQPSKRECAEMIQKPDFKPPTNEEIEKLLNDLLAGTKKERLKPFDVGYVSALEWVLGRTECLYER